ncbi:MAG: terminase TerL endonuclease subunit [Shewanella sp.]
MVLESFQKKFITEIYDNPHTTRRAILSLARKNGKTALIAAILLAHIAGPEARQNSQIVSGARSRDQASLVYSLAAKMVQMSSILSKRVRVVPSSKRLVGLVRNVEYRALAADGTTAHGLSPVLAILDELGQVRGPQDDFVDAITSSQGAHENPLIITISTQAANDNDLLSVWIDDALTNVDKHTVCHLYSADKTCELTDKAAWRAANPAIGLFRSEKDVEEQALQAVRMPSSEATFRNLILNQRVEAKSPFISRSLWLKNSGRASPPGTEPVYIGLDLSANTDLTAMACVFVRDGKTHVEAHAWSPADTLRDRAKKDRAPYEVWAKEGFLQTPPGKSIDYEFVARYLIDYTARCNVAVIAFDPWRMDIFKAALRAQGAPQALLDLLKPFGQGYKSMTPALETLENLLLEEKVLHGGNPVLTMCAANAIAVKDPAGNRKLDKMRATGRIDCLVALAMAVGSIASVVETSDISSFLESPVIL